ncbi:OprD family porin [Stutzerimonas stutzeri]|uniref:OprD family porin n=1 Tax=Stutzerimonas stutzeri TaxID=316 RepID=UPI00210B13CA|nr:OprD family porin [Stutzerimonas stutzeri]MCQ4260491.1 OprD family porin [Stutzerimonas stutzeri]
MQAMKWSALALAVTAATSQLAVASEQSESAGFVADSNLTLLNRNYYFARDNRASGAAKSRIEEWAHGMLLTYESGFTQGTVGFGVDLHAGGAIKLDSGRGTSGTGLLPVDSDGRAADELGFAGGAAKVRVSNTTLKYGDLTPTAPVFSPGTGRIFASTANGFQLSSNELEGLTIDAGYFTSLRDRNRSLNRDGDISLVYAGGIDAQRVGYLGGTYQLTDSLSATLYGSKYEDVWTQYYGNLNYILPLADDQSLAFDFNVYDTRDEGSAQAGNINTTAWSLAAGYTFGAHRVSLSHQQVNGNSPMDYISMDGTNAGDSIYLANSSQWSDFNAPGEKSVQARYDLNMAAYGVPGLSLMARYIKGDIDGASVDPDGAYAYYAGDAGKGKEWERDLEARYVVQDGDLKDLSVRVRYATARGFAGDIDELRVITEYPLDIL